MTQVKEDLAQRIRTLEKELQIALEEKERAFRYRWDHGKAKFEGAALSEHRQLKRWLPTYILHSRFLALLTAPHLCWIHSVRFAGSLRRLFSRHLFPDLWNSQGQARRIRHLRSRAAKVSESSRALQLYVLLLRKWPMRLRGRGGGPHGAALVSHQAFTPSPRASFALPAFLRLRRCSTIQQANRNCSQRLRGFADFDFVPAWEHRTSFVTCVFKSPADCRPASAFHAYNVESLEMQDLIKKLEDEIALLENELRIQLPREIAKARAHGDLSENAEYHAAKERQGMVNARLGQLRARLRELSMVDYSRIPRDRVGLGSSVKVLDLTKEEEMTYKLVTSEQADVAKGQISTTSPIGRALLGKKVGETVKVLIPGGTREMEILQLTTMHDLDDSTSG
jgi:transcription elongation factor GreA